jgi:hypothetical protein
MDTLWVLLRMSEASYRKTYPILSFHQQIKSGWILFPVDILQHADSPIVWVNLECWRCLVTLESIIKRILNKAVEPCICVGCFYI